MNKRIYYDHGDKVAEARIGRVDIVLYANKTIMVTLGEDSIIDTEYTVDMFNDLSEEIEKKERAFGYL